MFALPKRVSFRHLYFLPGQPWHPGARGRSCGHPGRASGFRSFDAGTGSSPVSRFHTRAGWLLAALLAVLAATAPAMAHEFRPAYLEVEETAAGQYTLQWRTPVLAGVRLPVVLQLPEGVTNLRQPVIMDLADSRLERRWIDAGPEGLPGKRIEFPGLQYTITRAVIRVGLLDGRNWMVIARPGQPWDTSKPRGPP